MLLVIIALSCIAALLSPRISGQDICPATTGKCYCEITYGTMESLYCDNLGSVANVPAFQSSSRSFIQLAIRYNSAIEAVQNYAFDGLQLNSLYLQGLQIRLVDEFAFEGLGGSLQDLYLDHNQLESLPALFLRNLTKLRYVGLNNNILASISGGMFAKLGQLSTLQLSYNEIEMLGVDNFLGLGTLNGLYLKQNRIRGLTPGVFDPLVQLRILDLSFNRLSSDVISGTISALVSLQRLTLSNNQLTVLDGLLAGLRQLTILDLSWNNIESIQSGQFDDGVKLTSLNMSTNSISSIAERAFANATGLQNLYLDNNRLTAIAADIFANMSGLRILVLNRNAITDVAPGSFSGMANMVNLYLSGNLLEVVGKGWFDGQSKLQLLDMSSNRINTIDVAAFAGLSTLKTLNLQNNKLVTLTPEIFQGLQSLSTLNVDRNFISFLDENSFSYLTGLRYLHLEYNNISEVPSLLFQNNPNLATIGLSYNRISVIDPDAYPIQTQYLYLDNNRIIEIPRNAFPIDMQLAILNLSSNFINVVHQESLSRLPYLLTLALDNNHLTDLPDNMLKNDQNLITLSMGHNRLRNITSPTVFRGLTKAAIMELDNNQIITVAHESVAHLTGLTRLDLSNNPIRCDCIADWMRGYAPLVGIMDTVCTSPAFNSGQLVACFNHSDVCTIPTTPLNSTLSLCNAMRFVTTKTTPLPTTRTSTTTTTTNTLGTTVHTKTQMISSTTQTLMEILPKTLSSMTFSEILSTKSSAKTSPEIFSTTLRSSTSTEMLPAAQTTKTVAASSSSAAAAANNMSTELPTTVLATGSSNVTLPTIRKAQTSTETLQTTASSEILPTLKAANVSTATPSVTSAAVLTETRSTQQTTISARNKQTDAQSPSPSSLPALSKAQQSTQIPKTQSSSEMSMAVEQSIHDTTPVLISSKPDVTSKDGSQETMPSVGTMLSSVTKTPTSKRVSLEGSIYPETSSFSSSSSSSSFSSFSSTSFTTSVSEETSRSDTYISTEILRSLSDRKTHEPDPSDSTVSPSYETSAKQFEPLTPYLLSSSVYPPTDRTSNPDAVIELKVFPAKLSIAVMWNISTNHRVVGLRLFYRRLHSDQDLGSVSIPPTATTYTISGPPLKPGLEFAVCLECTLSTNASHVVTYQKCDVTRLAAQSTESPMSDESSRRTLIIVIVIPILAAIAIALLIVVICRLRVARNRKAGDSALRRTDSDDGTEAHLAQGSQKVLLTDHAKLQSLKHVPATGTHGMLSNQSTRPRSPPLSSAQKSSDKPLNAVTFDNPIYPSYSHQYQPRNTLSFSNNSLNRTHSPTSGNVEYNSGFPNSSAVIQTYDDNPGDIILTSEQQRTFSSSDDLVPVTQP